MAELERDLPSIRKIQSLIKEKKEVEVKIITNDVLNGKIFWQDTQFICILDSQEHQIMIRLEALVYIKPKE